ncbi:hypothetical protein M514_14150, partial [Trichuris suis]
MPPKHNSEPLGERKPIGIYRLFDPETETWECWFLQFRGYLEMNCAVEDDIRRSCLVTSLAPKCFEELRRACLPKSPYDFTFPQLQDLMTKLFGNRIVLLKERSKFFTLRQTAAQTPMQFANYLRHMAAGCDFENFNTEAALLVQFVNGMRNQSVRTTLLARGKDLTFENALSYLQLEEDVQREDVKNAEEAMDARTCHAVKAHMPSRQVNGGVQKCGRCGKGDHGKDGCPFTRFKCFNCGRIGHLARVCRRKQASNVPDKRQQDAPTRAQRDQKKVRQVQGIESHMLQAYHLGASSPFTVKVVIAGHPTVMELDTGASVTIANSVFWERM